MCIIQLLKYNSKHAELALSFFFSLFKTGRKWQISKIHSDIYFFFLRFKFKVTFLCHDIKMQDADAKMSMLEKGMDVCQCHANLL